MDAAGLLCLRYRDSRQRSINRAFTNKLFGECTRRDAESQNSKAKNSEGPVRSRAGPSRGGVDGQTLRDPSPRGRMFIRASLVPPAPGAADAGSGGRALDDLGAADRDRLLRDREDRRVMRVHGLAPFAVSNQAQFPRPTRGTLDRGCCLETSYSLSIYKSTTWRGQDLVL